MRLLLGVVTLLSSAASAQDATVPPLERIIDTDYSIRLPAQDCTVPDAVLGIARRYQLIAGAEFLLVDCQPSRQASPRGGEKMNLRGLSVGEALTRLVAIDSRYRWVERDGLIVVRPVEAWADPKNLLNFTTESFVLDDVNVGGALDAVVGALTGQSRSSDVLEASAEGTEQGRRRFSVKTGATSVGEALDAIVRAHGHAMWQFSRGLSRDNPTPFVWLQTFDGTWIGASTHRRKPR